MASENYSALMSHIRRDLAAAEYYKFSMFGGCLNKDRIAEALRNPFSNEKLLRQAVRYVYVASPHFRRIVEYFASLSDLSSVIVPKNMFTSDAAEFKNEYDRALRLADSLDIKTQYRKVLTVCFREDVAFCTLWQSDGYVLLQLLPPEQCEISEMEDGVFNVSFDFRFFRTRESLLPYFPPEFTRRYNAYRDAGFGKDLRRQTLDSATSFAIKFNDDSPEYSVPPFAGLLRDVFDLEDYRALKLRKTELENYALLALKVPIDSGGNWLIDGDRVKEFYDNLDSVLPEFVGSIATPMDMGKFSFEKSNAGDADTVAEAEQNLFSAAGVSSLLFNNEKASANALSLSIKADQSLCFKVVESISAALNRFLSSLPYGQNFKITFLDVSPYNREEASKNYIYACSYGFPMVSFYCAAQGVSQSQMDALTFLENDVLNLKKRLIPLSSSATQSSSSEESGAPEKDVGDLSDKGEEWREAQ